MAQIHWHSLELRKAYGQIVSPANIAKVILDELQGSNLFNRAKLAMLFVLGMVAVCSSFVVLTVWH